MALGVGDGVELRVGEELVEYGVGVWLGMALGECVGEEVKV